MLIAATAILSALNVGVQNPTDGSWVVVKNLLSVEGLHWFLPNVIKNFAVSRWGWRSSPQPWAPVFTERWALLPALMVGYQPRYASYMVLFIAFFSHISSDARW